MPPHLMCLSFFAVLIWKSQYGTSGYPENVLTLSLVSQRNLPLTVTLVSAS